MFLKASLLLVTVYFLYFHGLGAVGLLGPDEPRYAAIGREMARSGDWVTPRLWGQPWFEKPALLYWMEAAAFRFGLGDDLAPRFPVAFAGAAFLAFYYWVLRREFGGRAAFFAASVLGTSAGWVAFSHAAVTDLPLAVTFSAAMLICLPWIEGGAQRAGSVRLTVAAGLFGAAVLAKGLVPLILAVPLVWAGRRRRLTDWLRPAPIAVFAAVAVPWYALCTLANGTSFLQNFFWRQHFERFATDVLKHGQPFWFYLPVLLAGLFPWTPLVALLFRRGLYTDARRKFLLLWLVFGLLFFSASENKLPGYLLPLFPALAALLGIALAEVRRAQWVLAASALLLFLLPAIAAILPQSLARGVTHASVALVRWWPWVPVLALAAAVWWQAASGRRELAVGCLVVAMTFGTVWLEARTFPLLDRSVSARQTWRELSPLAGQVCLEEANRSWSYNLAYYAGGPLPDCAQVPQRFHIRQQPGRLAVVDHGQ